LLDTWNRESGRKAFSREEILLAEKVLSHFAYHLQVNNGILTANDVEMITLQAMTRFYQQQATEINRNVIEEFIETLRRSSGLFAEVGEVRCWSQFW
jgi:hypothetical protein